MEEPRRLHFLIVEALRGYTFNPHLPEGLRFTDDDTNFEITVMSESGGHRDLEVRAETSRIATAKQIEFVEALIDQRYMPSIGNLKKLPLVSNEKILIAEDGSISGGYTVRWNIIPKDLQEVLREAEEHLREKAMRFLRLLRWQQDASGPSSILPKPSKSPVIYWKTSHEKYYLAPLPDIETITLSSHGGIHWSTEYQEEFRNLWSAKIEDEPLGHQLLREAKSAKDENSRAALLIAYTALEVGVKQHIAACVPDASWLAMYVPTPPLFKIIRDYLPQLHVGKVDFQNWSNINSRLKLIHDFTDDRNRLAHRGEPLKGSVDDYIKLTQDLLYIFDVLEGHEWAKAYVRNEMREALKWNYPSRSHNVTVTLRQSD